MIPVLLIGIFLFTQNVLASSIFINEISWMGSTTSTNHEWIELYNNTDSDIDLSNWSLVAQDSSPSIQLSGSIIARGYFLLERSTDDSVPGILADLIYTGALGNSGEFLELKNGTTTIDIIDAISGWPAGDNNTKQTMEKIENGWQSSVNPLGTPGQSNSVYEDQGNSTSTETVDTNATSTEHYLYNNIIINEFVSYPLSGNNEWIELYNTTTSTINLDSFTISDGTGVIYELSDNIAPEDFYLIEFSSNKLNNTGDIIYLKSNTTIIDVVVYGIWDDGDTSDNLPKTKEGESLARNSENIFQLTTITTPLSQNIIHYESTSNTPPPTNDKATSQTQKIYKHYYSYGDIVINELVSDPQEDESEWIELYNNTNHPIDLENWILEEGSGSQTVLSGVISPRKWLVIEDPKGQLNNNGDIVILKDSNNKIIDSVAYGVWNDDNILDNSITARDPNSIARIIDGKSTDNNYADFRSTSAVTPGMANVIDSIIYETTETFIPTITTTTPTTIISIATSTPPIINYPKIIISELLPNPDGSDIENEFIELYNPNKIDIDLSDWVLDDSEGGSKPYKINNISIEPGEYLIFPRSQTNLALNNNYDSVRLLDPLGNIIDQVDYNGLKKDEAYIYLENKWLITTQHTPGEQNIQQTQLALITSSSDTSNSTVTITGTVSVLPDVLGTQFFYITDSTAQIYSYTKDFPDLQLGDEISVTGQWSDTSSVKRLKIKTQQDIRVISRNNIVYPLDISISDIGENIQDELVKISGEIIEISGNYLYITDGVDETRIYLKRSIGISKSNFQEGDLVDVIGITSLSSGDYRVTPRFDSDITITGSVAGAQEFRSTQEKEKINWTEYIPIMITCIIFVLLWSYRDIKYHFQKQKQGR